MTKPAEVVGTTMTFASEGGVWSTDPVTGEFRKVEFDKCPTCGSYVERERLAALLKERTP